MLKKNGKADEEANSQNQKPC